MRQLELGARTFLRKVGLAGPILKLIHLPATIRKKRLLAQYERERPTRVQVQIDQFHAVLKVTSAQEYAHYLSVPEAGVMREVFAKIRPGDVVWDVGANVGMYTLLLGGAVGERGKVLAFEPMRSCNERLRENTSLNGLSNIIPMDVALGAERAEMRLAVDPGGLDGDHRLVANEAQSEGRPTEIVPVVPGDELRRERNLEVPNLIKLDVQGAEGDVLRGLDQTLRDPQCRAVIYEVHFNILQNSGRGDVPVRIEEQLRNCGFHIRRLDLGHVAAYKDQ